MSKTEDFHDKIILPSCKKSDKLHLNLKGFFLLYHDSSSIILNTS